MPLRVLIVPDKFKGTLTAQQAVGAIAEGWMNARPQDDIEAVPMSDGGDGFGEVMAQLMEAEERTLTTVDAAHRPREAKWWYNPAITTAIIESAQIVGLALLPQGRYHPFELDTFGLGAMIRAAWEAGATQVIIGVGGSATNDGGFGMARGIGWNFLEANEMPIEKWVKLDKLARWESPILPQINHIVAVDVNNPLLGSNGCSRIYGPQKGLRTEQAPLAESFLRPLAEMAQREFQVDIANEPGAGAAGGLGFGLRTFLGARIESGFELFAQAANLEYRIEQADLVITAEGGIDRQTMMGKGTGRIAETCRRLNKRCIGLAGMVEGQLIMGHQKGLFHSIAGITPTLTHPADAKARPDFWLTRLANKVATELREP
ncbi:MAG TPA: glycerate kinase [Candidatus Limnocylindria bacterium]|nr:glycerate kinase [Candidatus Limnocylindria bacterium]